MRTTKVLIVDDEVEFASTLSERLSLRKYDAKAVYCAEDAFAIARSNPPDVVLLDLKIPGMEGTEIGKIIKQFNPAIQIILLTGESENKIISENLGKDISDYIVKPVEIGELTKKIDNAMKEKEKLDHSKGQP
ncbi:MAG: response regulator [Nitrospirae bacterium]|nr:response regulator [Nitrospirota bacterium]